MSTLLRIPEERMPATAALLRAVFGTYAVPVQRPAMPGDEAAPTHMEAALLGVDYVKLLVGGGQKLPVLTLVGPEGDFGTLFLRWLKEVLHVPVRPNLLSDVQRANESRGLVLWNGEPDDEVLAMLQAIQDTTEVCFYPSEPSRHQHVRIDAALCLHCRTAPDPQRFRTLHWVRLLDGVELAPPELAAAIVRLRAEFWPFTQLLTRHPFNTKPSTALWFHPDQYTPPEVKTNTHAA